MSDMKVRWKRKVIAEGTSFYLNIPALYVDSMNILKGDELSLTLEGNKLVIEVKDD